MLIRSQLWQAESTYSLITNSMTSVLALQKRVSARSHFSCLVKPDCVHLQKEESAHSLLCFDVIVERRIHTFITHILVAKSVAEGRICTFRTSATRTHCSRENLHIHSEKSARKVAEERICTFT